jgi:hypothetical protein
MMFLNILLAACAASLFLICVCAVVGLGHLRRITDGVNAIVHLAQEADERQRAIMANIRGRDYDPR